MIINFFKFMMLQEGGGASQQGDWLTSLFPLIIIFVIFYFFLIAPARKQRKQLHHMIESLSNGDKVITTGGIYGVIAGIGDNKFQLKIANNIKIEVAKSAIAAKITDKTS